MSESKGFLAVCLTFGYVESQGIGTVMFQNTKEPFKTEAEAIKSLGQDLLAIYYEKHPRPKKKKCCQKSKGNFCSTCGKSLDAPEIDVESFKDWLQGLVSDTNDSFGYHDYADGRDIYWENSHPGVILQLQAEGYECVFIHEKADEEICNALGLDDEL